MGVLHSPTASQTPLPVDFNDARPAPNITTSSTPALAFSAFGVNREAAGSVEPNRACEEVADPGR